MRFFFEKDTQEFFHDILVVLSYVNRLLGLTFLRDCCLTVSENMHNLFEANSWFIQPQDSIIEQYYASKDKPEDFPNISMHVVPY